MTGVQMLLSVAAVMMLGIIGVNMRNTTMENNQLISKNMHSQEAIAIGRAMVDEIGSKLFDQANDGNKVVRLADLTSPGFLGNGSSEIYPHFNDVDDYHNKTFKSGTTSASPRCLQGTEGYSVNCIVYYVNQDNPSLRSTTATFAKRVDLKIWSRYSTDTLRMSHIAAY